MQLPYLLSPQQMMGYLFTTHTWGVNIRNHTKKKKQRADLRLPVVVVMGIGGFAAKDSAILLFLYLLHLMGSFVLFDPILDHGTVLSFWVLLLHIALLVLDVVLVVVDCGSGSVMELHRPMDICT